MATAMQGEYRAARGADLAAKCADWMDANPDALCYIERRALEEAGAERRFSVRLLLEEARSKDFTDRRGRGTRINNVIAPALARRIADDHPEVRPYMRLRRSMVDEIEGLADAAETAVRDDTPRHRAHSDNGRYERAEERHVAPPVARGRGHRQGWRQPPR